MTLNTVKRPAVQEEAGGSFCRFHCLVERAGPRRDGWTAHANKQRAGCHPAGRQTGACANTAQRQDLSAIAAAVAPDKSRAIMPLGWPARDTVGEKEEEEEQEAPSF